MPTLSFDEENHKYFVDGIEKISTTTLLKRFGLYPDVQFATDLDRWRGKAIHKMMEYHHKNTLDVESLDPLIQPYRQAWWKFERDFGFKAIGWEKPLWDPIFDYCGTPDVWGPVGNEFWILDYKSGPVKRVTGIQLSSYQNLLYANNMIPTGKRVRKIGLQLKNDGTYKPEYFNDPVDDSIWSMIMSVYNWGKNNV